MTAFGATEALRVRDTCMCLNTRKLARTLTNRYDEALRPTGLRMTQFAVLAHLRAYQPIAPGDLAAAMDLDQTTMSRNLEVLRRAGYLTATKSGRYRVIELTPAGQALLDDAYPRWNAVQRDAIASVGGEELWLRLRSELAAAADSHGPATGNA